MISLKLATWDHLPDLIEMAEEFHKNSPYAEIEEFNEARVSDVIISCFDNPTERIVIVLTDETNKAVGMIIAATSLSIFNYGKVASEIAWWVSPQYRGKHSIELHKAYEYWAKNVAKCSVIQSALLEDDSVDRVSRYYLRQLFIPVERAFIKKV